MIETIDDERCTGCGICADLCPLDTLRVDPFQKEMPPCQAACPAKVDIRGYNYFLKNRTPWEAVRILEEYLPYPAITGRICHHPCEQKCARKQVDEAVNIPALERYAGDYSLAKGAQRQARLHAGKAAVIGSGPAGLAGAYFLVRLGYGVTVFEMSDEIGGAFRCEVAKNRLPEEVLEGQIQYMEDMGVAFEMKKELGKEITIDGLKDQFYDAVLLATGPKYSLPEGIAVEKDGAVHDCQTEMKKRTAGVFVCGGGVKQRLPIAHLIASVKMTVSIVDGYMRGQPCPGEPQEGTRLVKRIPKKKIVHLRRQEPFSGKSGILNREEAFEEARRCMTCGGKAFIAHPEDCMTCFMCDMACPSEAIYVHPFKEVIPSPIEDSAGGEDHV